MRHELLDDATGQVAATSVVVGVHIDARIRKAIRLPDDERHQAIKMKEQKGACAESKCAKTAI